MKRWRAVCWWLVVLAVAATVPGCAVQSAAGPALDSKAEQILKAASDTLRQAQSLRVSLTSVRDEYLESGQLVQTTHEVTVVAVRPNSLLLANKGDDGTDWAAWYDGQTVTMLDKVNNEYAREEFRGTTAEMILHLRDKYDLDLPMGDLLAARMYESAKPRIREACYLGLATIAGRPAHHILCTQENLDWQVWVDAGEQPFVLKLAIVFKNEPGQPGFITTFSKWDLNASIKDGTFAFTPPSGAAKVQISDLIRED
jgi:hypothetical protein